MHPRRAAAVAFTVIVVLLSSACSGRGPDNPAAAAPAPVSTTTATPTTSAPPPETTTSSTTTTAPLPPPTTAAAPPPTSAPPRPAGTLAWKPCGGLQCATLTVPVDYANPGGATIGLAVARKPARRPAARIGSLVINPGGPGNSGVDDLPGELRVLTPTLQNRFDVVSWDPRGIERSAPVSCTPKPEPSAAPPPPPDGQPDPPADPAPTDPAAQQALAEGYAAYGQACLQATGDLLLRRVGTDSTVEDLERLRQALGDEKLTFIGHSAGTLIGAVYADRYPDRVRAMVLDGPIDPSLSLDRMTMAQAVSFERTLDNFLAWCRTHACAYKPQGDYKAALLALIDQVRQKPLPAPKGELVGVDKLINGMMGRLYSRSRWPSLGDALGAATRNDGAPLGTLADRYVNHGSSNAAEARQAILCLDHPAPTDPKGYPALAEEARRVAPVFGPIFLWSVLSCGVWPVPATLPARPVRAFGAPSIMVVGTTGDPATPQAWAESLADQLEGGILVLRQGEEHVAYYYSGCVRGLVDAYLVDGRPPPDPTTCRT